MTARLTVSHEQVYTEGNSFAGAYHEAKDAIHFVLELQLELLKAAWPAALSEHPLCLHVDQAVVEGKTTSPPLFAGLRVRAAVHSGIPSGIEVTSHMASWQSAAPLVASF